MTREQIESLSEKEAKDKLIALFENRGTAISVIVIQEKIEGIMEQFDELTIDVASENTTAFDNFVKITDKLLKIQKDNTERLAMIDEDIMREEREKRVGAKQGTLESKIAARSEK